MQSVGILCIESNFYSLNLVAQFDSWTQLQFHALLHRGQRQQQEGLPINVLGKETQGKWFCLWTLEGRMHKASLEEQEGQFALKIKLFYALLFSPTLTPPISPFPEIQHGFSEVV